MSSLRRSHNTVKLADIAKATGLSLSTASRVLNRRKFHERLSRETTARVHAAARKLGYRPHSGAQALATNRSRVVGVAFHLPFIADTTHPSVLNNEYLATLLGFTEAFFRARGYDLLLLNVKDAAGLSSRCLDKFRGCQIDGIWTAGTPPSSAIRLLERENVPSVIVDYSGLARVGSYVSFDNEGAIALVLDHLQSLGHKRIAFLDRRGKAVPRDISVRHRAFRREIQKRGLSATSAMFADWPPAHVEGDQAAGLWAAERIAALPRKQRPTALITISNIPGFVALQALRERGFSCPQDISIVGFDDLVLSRLVSPALTIIDHRLQAIAERASTILLEAMERRLSGESFIPVREQIQGCLIERGSTGSAPK